MKIFITNNLPYNSNNENVPLFKTVEERDNFVKKELTNDIAISDLEWLKTRTFTKTSATTMTFRVDNKNIADGYQKDYCITDIQGKIEYWNIIGNYSINAKTIEYTAQLDVYMTFPTILSEIEQGVMTHGHIPDELLQGLTFDGGDKIPNKITKLEKIKNNKLTDTTWMYVFTKPKNTTATYEFKLDNGEQVDMAYRIFCAPIKTATVKGMDSGEEKEYNLTAKELTRHLAFDIEPLDNSTIIGVKFSSFSPVETYDDNFLITEYSSTNRDGNVKIQNKSNLTSARETFLELIWNSKNVFLENTFEYTFEGNIIDNLDGIRKWDIIVENNIVLELPISAFDSANKKITFILKTALTPNETEEYIEIISDTYTSIRGINNTWKNNKDWAYSINALENYKTGSPISSSLELLLGPINGFIRGGSMATWFGANKFINAPNKLKYDTVKSPISKEEDLLGWINGDMKTEISNPRMVKNLKGIAGPAAAFGALGAITSEVKIIEKRQDMKRRPNSVVGSGAALPDLAFNKNLLNVSVVEYTFTTSERDNIINGIYRSGVAVENYVFDTFSKIERDKFNLLDISNIDIVLPREYYLKNGDEVITQLIDFYKEPRRYWKSFNTFLDFDYTDRNDNELITTKKEK